MSKQLARTVITGFNRQPAMLALAHADLLVDAIQNLSSANAKEENESAKEARSYLASAYGYRYANNDKPFVYADGIAFIPIHGLLINRFSGSWGWVTGYNFVREQLKAAIEDADVNLIVFDVNSGGGMVAGCFELCKEIRESRAIKPSLAVVDASCYSACYALASSATKIVCTPSGGAGSIGVVCMHADWSKALQEAGIKVSFIFSGDHKVDGNPYQALPASVKADIQKSVDVTRKEFVTLVAENRGLDPEIVHGTQARCYSAGEALDLGLIDAIAPPIEAVSAFLNERSRSENDKEKTMSGTAAKSGVDTTASPDTKNATTAITAPVEAAVTTQVSAATERTSERERIKAITTHAAAEGKSKLANHLALDTDMSVDAAAAILSAAAVEDKKEADTGTSAFQAAMDASDHPNVGANAEGSGTGEDLSTAQRILKAQALATGVSLK